ncbi:MAG: hypothetical protein H7A24_07440 [Leptospiraceae bacterium]|nr:hypothetical protein [Leptospiraceae bacterium]MCP5511697.1 hypothetical protein [Leptospiraceae bacterium]
MKKNTLALVFLSLIFLVQCSKKAEITHDGGLFSDPELTTKVMDLKKGTIVDALEYRHHGWSVRHSIKIKAEGKVGYISPSIAVVGQDPKNSVYKWGYKKDYKYFYDPNDKKHFDKGYEFKHLANLPKDRIPLDELLKDAKLETSNETIEAPKEEAAPAETPSENTPQ